MSFNVDKVFEGLQGNLINDFEKISAHIKHCASKGVVREGELIKFLEKYLPYNVAVSTGAIISTDKQISNQTDIIVYDKFRCPCLLEKGNHCIFPIEGVYSVIEIKSKLDKKELEDSFKKIQKIKKMHKEAYKTDYYLVKEKCTLYNKDWNQYIPTMGFVIAYDSIDLKKLRDYLVEFQINEPLEHRIDSIWVLKKGYITNFNNKDGKHYCFPSQHTSLAPLFFKNPLLLLFHDLYGVHSKCWMHYFDFWKYVDQNMEIGTYTAGIHELEQQKLMQQENIQI